jgi:hypothetical protein
MAAKRRRWGVWCERRRPLKRSEPQDQPGWLDSGQTWATGDEAQAFADRCAQDCPTWRYTVRAK